MKRGFVPAAAEPTDCTWCGKDVGATAVAWERWSPGVPGLLRHDHTRFCSLDCMHTHCCVWAPAACLLHAAIQARANGRALQQVPPRSRPVAPVAMQQENVEPWSCSTFPEEEELHANDHIPVPLDT